MSTYNQEALTALYAALMFLKENDMPTSQVEQGIALIESKNKAV